jgi:hypothetical protein
MNEPLLQWLAHVIGDDREVAALRDLTSERLER